jgi:hypothetical protein
LPQNFGVRRTIAECANAQVGERTGGRPAGSAAVGHAEDSPDRLHYVGVGVHGIVGINFIAGRDCPERLFPSIRQKIPHSRRPLWGQG